MALLKTKNSDYGISGDFWKISRVNVDRIRQKLVCHLSLFVNQEVFENGGISIEMKTYIFEEEQYDFLPTDNILEKCYLKIKSCDVFFSDAIDIL